MSEHTLLAYYLSNLKIDLFIAHNNLVASDWRDIDYTPDYSKFYYIVEGEGWLKIGDQEYFPKPGQLILMPEGVRQSYSSISDHTFLKYWCHFSAKIGDVNLFKLIDLPHVCTINDKDIVRDIFNHLIIHANSSEVCAKLMSKTKLMELFSYYIMNIDIKKISLNNLNSIEKLTDILNYIHLHIEKDIAIHELADAACMHPNYFIRFFKQQMGVPPMQYITRKKIEKSKELLASTPCTVSEIAELVGFHDLFYFSKQFKKIAGLTPTEFRKQKPQH